MAGIVYGALLIAAIAELLPMLAVVAGAPDLARLFGSDAPIGTFIRTLGGPVMTEVNSLAAMRGRRLGLTTSSPAPLFPLGPLLVLGALAALVAADLLTPATGLPGLAATAATPAIGVAAQRLVMRRNPNWRIRD